ncbi:MAG: acyltransferase [Paracoccaceae bacterium]|nr:acyltransferase [Paracoccaceae bacterium]
MGKLGSATQGQDNNFNLIRMAAAVAVLVSHAWPLSYGRGTVEPLQGATGHSLGMLAVYVFFLISGYFITASWERSAGLSDFARARARRILPGLAVALLLIAFLLGPVVSDLSPRAYLAAPATWSFVLGNLSFLRPQFTLPGVFTANPYPAVAGSIWTLQHEATCYAVLALAGWLGFIGRRRLPVLAVLYALFWALPHLPYRIEMWRILSLPFAVGVAAHVYRRAVVVSLPLMLALAGGAVALRGTALAFPALILGLGYGVLWLGTVPGGAIRGYNRLGDYSYGFYIYAMPAQGLVALGSPAPTPFVSIALGLPLALLMAVLSWHLVERPALARGRRQRAQAICNAPTQAAPASSSDRPA